MDSNKKEFLLNNKRKISISEGSIQCSNTEEYIVKINQPKFIDDLETNCISTSKYTYFDCIPKILIEQFSKMANIYFLMIALMQVNTFK